MNKKQLAEKLQGVQYTEIPKELIKYAKDSNLVIITGQSDDGVCLNGAIEDETGLELFFYKNELLQKDDNFEDINDQVEFLNKFGIDLEPTKVLAKFGTDTKFDWVFESKLDFETFEMEDDDTKFCLGIVISLDEIGI